jgi:hypothetical protein
MGPAGLFQRPIAEKAEKKGPAAAVAAARVPAAAGTGAPPRSNSSSHRPRGHAAAIGPHGDPVDGSHNAPFGFFGFYSAVLPTEREQWEKTLVITGGIVR